MCKEPSKAAPLRLPCPGHSPSRTQGAPAPATWQDAVGVALLCSDPGACWAKSRSGPAQDPQPPPGLQATQPRLVSLTWPPQVPAPLGQCGAAPIIAVAPWTGRAVLLKGVLWAPWRLAVTVFLEVTPVPRGAAQLPSWLHLTQESEAHHRHSRPQADVGLLPHPASRGPSPRWPGALTLHSWQQAPWAHSAPTASWQVVALQQWFWQSWGEGATAKA